MTGCLPMATGGRLMQVSVAVIKLPEIAAGDQIGSAAALPRLDGSAASRDECCPRSGLDFRHTIAYKALDSPAPEKGKDPSTTGQPGGRR